MRSVKQTRKPRLNTPTRPRDAAATRVALIQAAAQIFKGQGYFSTDSNHIARAAGYAPASFYKHFKDKADILQAVYADYAAEEWGQIHTAAERGRALPEQLRRILEALIAFQVKWARFRTDLRAIAGIEPEIAKALITEQHRQIDLLARLTGLSPKKDLARLVWMRMIAQRLTETVLEGESLGARRAALIDTAEEAIAAILEMHAP